MLLDAEKCAAVLQKPRPFRNSGLLLDTNEGSRRTILKNGGRFDGTAYRADENKTLERYWITL